MVMARAGFGVVIDPPFDIVVIFGLINRYLFIYVDIFPVVFPTVIVDCTIFFIEVAVAKVFVANKFLMTTNFDIAAFLDVVGADVLVAVVMDVLRGVLDASARGDGPIRFANGAIIFDRDRSSPADVGDRDIALFWHEQENQSDDCQDGGECANDESPMVLEKCADAVAESFNFGAAVIIVVTRRRIGVARVTIAREITATGVALVVLLVVVFILCGC